MINVEKVKRYCREDISLIKNYEKAVQDKTKVWECHHINELTFTPKELIKMKMYFHRPANELVFLTRAEHRKIHYRLCSNEKNHRLKIIESNKTRNIASTEFGRKFKEHYNFGHREEPKLYDKERHFYYKHGHCSWEV